MVLEVEGQPVLLEVSQDLIALPEHQQLLVVAQEEGGVVGVEARVLVSNQVLAGLDHLRLQGHLRYLLPLSFAVLLVLVLIALLLGVIRFILLGLLWEVDLARHQDAYFLALRQEGIELCRPEGVELFASEIIELGVEGH